MNRNLITFSGGSDSALLVYKLLTETSDENTLLILSGNRKSHRAPWALSKERLIMLQPLLAELKIYGDFKVIYEIVDDDSIDVMLDDMWYAYAIKKYASRLNDGLYDRLVSGVGFEQNNGKFMKNHELRGVRPVFEAKHLFNKTVTKGEFWQPFVTNDFYQSYNRWHLYKDLPQNLMEKTLSCNTSPACEVCGKCLYNKKVIQCIADGWTAEDLQEWTEERSRYYGGNRDAQIISWIYPESGVPRKMRCGVSNENMIGSTLAVSDKETFTRWYDTIEYTLPTDYGLIDWNLTKRDWNPENYI